MKGKLLGYIVGSWSHDDFFVGLIESRGAELVGYYRDPGEAKRFRDTAKAQWFCDHLDRPDLYVCRLIDHGDRWFVEWPVPPGAPPAPSACPRALGPNKPSSGTVGTLSLVVTPELGPPDGAR
jgi:hypothetical protein